MLGWWHTHTHTTHSSEFACEGRSLSLCGIASQCIDRQPTMVVVVLVFVGVFKMRTALPLSEMKWLKLTTRICNRKRKIFFSLTLTFVVDREQRRRVRASGKPNFPWNILFKSISKADTNSVTGHISRCGAFGDFFHFFFWLFAWAQTRVINRKKRKIPKKNN